MKRLWPSIIGLWSLIFIALAPSSAYAERRVALVIGNAKYQNINKLENPLNDAPDFAEALRQLGFDVILRTDADKGGFDRALAEFARKAQGADAALFYYAGHGIQYQKQNYLLPTDIEVQDYNDVEFQAVSVSRVMTALERTNGVKIVILDACRDNPLDKQISASNRSIAGATRGLARVDRTEGLVVAYATAPDQVAQDGSGRNSPFTESLIRRLKEPGLEIATLFRRVTQDVYERTNGRQRPEVSISLLNDYYLNLGASDSLEWARVRESLDPADFQHFIQQFPRSPFAREAQYRIDLFARLQRENMERIAQAQERDAADKDRVRREAIEKEAQQLEAQRRELERLQAEAAAKEVERQAMAKRDAERMEAERRDFAARQEAARQEALRQETERKEAQKREALRQEVARLAIQKRFEADQLAKQQETDRIAAEQASRVAAQQEADRLAAQQLAAKQQADQRAAEQKFAEQKAAEQRVAEQKLAEQKAADQKLAEQRVAEQKAAEQREADRKQVALLAVQKRLEADQKAAEQQAADQRARDQAEEQRREADRQAVARLAIQRRVEQEQQKADLQAQVAAADPPRTEVTASRNVVPNRVDHQEALQAAEQQREQEQVDAEARELERLIAERKTAIGKEAERIDAEIRELDRRAVVRLAAQHRRAAAQIAESQRLEEQRAKTGANGPIGLALPPAK